MKRANTSSARLFGNAHRHRWWGPLCGLVAFALAAPVLAASLAEQIRGMPPAERVPYLKQVIATAETAEAHFHLGNAWFSLEKMDSAVTELSIATTMDTSYAKAWVNLGIVYDTIGKPGLARNAYQAAIRADPNDVLAYCHLGFLYYGEGDKTRAMELYQRALEIDPNSAQAHYNLGLAFAEARIFPEALAEWRLVIELDPDGDLGRLARENVELIQAFQENE